MCFVCGVRLSRKYYCNVYLFLVKKYCVRKKYCVSELLIFSKRKCVVYVSRSHENLLEYLIFFK